MAKKKEKNFDNSLRVRKKFQSMVFMGKIGAFEYSEPRKLGDMSKEELEAFYYAHDVKTRTRYLVGTPEEKKIDKETLPIKPEE